MVGGHNNSNVNGRTHFSYAKFGLYVSTKSQIYASIDASSGK